MGRLVLRFANREGIDTIEQHQSVIQQEGHVWWGWFKKAHEPFPRAALEALSDRVPQDVGLVNRDERTVYVARCDEVRFAPDDDSAVGTLSVRTTPAYYADAYLPAWFRLRAIEQSSEDAFATRFGGIPEGDPTIFEVAVEGGVPRLESRIDAFPVAPLEARGRSILHLSDLHFGEFHGFSDPRLPPNGGNPSLRDVLVEWLVQAQARYSFAAIVASGDFTSRGDANGLTLARTFMEEIAQAVNLGIEYVCVIPGNHDIYLENFPHFDRTYIAENPYRDFMRSLYGQNLTQIEQIRRIATTDEWDLRFVCVNSARGRDDATKEYGWVGHDRYEPLLRRVVQADADASAADLIDANVLNIGVIHHHVLPAPLQSWPEAERPVSITLDAGAIVADFQTSSIHLVLHGHQHVPFAGRVGRLREIGLNRWTGPGHDLLVVGCGSTGCERQQLTDEYPYNAFSIYTPEQQAVRVEVFRFNRGTPPIRDREVLLAL
jgi:hypothetical protein